MKKIISIIMIFVPFLMLAQNAISAYSLSRTELSGTARFMSMAGAFGALGGDLSAIQQNPGGIGIYRRSDVGVTLNIDMQSAKTVSATESTTNNQTKFKINNFGYVGTLERNSGILPFFNFGVTYNRPISFNHRYSGRIANINSSLTNYIASISNSNAFRTSELRNSMFTYNDPSIPWLSIMTYNAFINNPKDFDENGDGYNFKGLMNSKSKAFSDYEVIEEGGINEFNLHLGGNISNLAYWGVSFGLNTLDYSKYTFYGETIENATVVNSVNKDLTNKGNASFCLENTLKTKGTGWNFKFGVILRATDEIRIGAAVHTPTYWKLDDESYSSIRYKTINSSGDYVKSGVLNGNSGTAREVEYKLNTPLRFNISAAAVISDKAIVSTTYERLVYNTMRIKNPIVKGEYEKDFDISQSIGKYYKAMNIYRLGGEYRVRPTISVRLGYAYHTSPVNEDAIEDRIKISIKGTNPAYRFDKATQYFTCGFGFKHNNFYTDLAYVLESRKSKFSAFSPYNDKPSYETSYQYSPAPNAIVKTLNSEIVCTIGYRF